MCSSDLKNKTGRSFSPGFASIYWFFCQFQREQPLPCLSRKAPLFHGGSRFLVEQIHKGLLLGAQAALVRVDQHIPHLLALGRALLQHQMVLLQCPAGHGRCPHVGRGQPLQDRELAAPLIHVDTAFRVDMPAHTVAALLAGQLEIIVEDLHILVQLRQVADLLPGQRAVPVGQ